MTKSDQDVSHYRDSPCEKSLRRTVRDAGLPALRRRPVQRRLTGGMSLVQRRLTGRMRPTAVGFPDGLLTGTGRTGGLPKPGKRMRDPGRPV